MNKTDLVDAPYLRTDLPEFRPGDTVKVHVRVDEAPAADAGAETEPSEAEIQG